MPRVSDDAAAGGYGSFHVPGVWAGVLREMRDYEAAQVWTDLGDPREVLTLDSAGYLVFAERARVDADDRHTVRLAAGEAVSVARAVLRASALRVPKDVLQDRSVKRFTVYPDDTMTFTDENYAALFIEENGL